MNVYAITTGLDVIAIYSNYDDAIKTLNRLNDESLSEMELYKHKHLQETVYYMDEVPYNPPSINHICKYKK